MKKSIKIVSILMMAIMMVMVSTPVFAKGELKANQIQANYTNVDMSDGQKLAGKILAFIRNAAIIAGVIIIAILGVKYMMGSLEEKADYKKSFIPLIVGIVVVMSATTIASLLFNTFTLGK